VRNRRELFRTGQIFQSQEHDLKGELTSYFDIYQSSVRQDLDPF